MPVKARSYCVELSDEGNQRLGEALIALGTMDASHVQLSGVSTDPVSMRLTAYFLDEDAANYAHLELVWAMGDDRVTACGPEGADEDYAPRRWSFEVEIQ